MSRTTALQRWSLGAAIGILAALAIAPPTGWLARLQLRMQALGAIPEMAGVAPELGLTSTPAPHIPSVNRSKGEALGLEVAAVLLRTRDFRERVAALRQLSGQFPDSPALYAHILRFATQEELAGNRRPEESLLTNLKPPAEESRRARASKEQFAQFEQDAATGERLDPDNAFFPFVRSIGLFHAYRDAEALEAIHRAAGKSRWEEYIAEEAHGVARLYEMQYGPRPALARAAVYAAILFPHLAGLRSSARVAAYKAVEAELAGRTEEGFQIRMDLARLGSRMREQGRSLISALVGIAITHVAMTRPGGAPHVERPPVPAAAAGAAMPDRENPDAWTRKQRDTFAAYLRRIGKPEHAEWMLKELAAADDSTRVTRAALDESAFGGGPFRALGIAWAVNLATLANLFSVLFLGGIGALLCRTRHIRAGRPMPKAAVFGLWLGVVAAGAAFALPATLPWMAVIAAAFALAAVLIGRSPGRRAQGVGVFVLAMSVSAVALGLLGLFAASQGRPAVDLVQFLQMLLSGEEPEIAIGLAAGSLFIPMLIGLVILVVSRWSRVPITVGLARGFRGLAAPVSCALAVIYAFSLVWTVRQEAAVNQGLERSLQHEGIYLSGLVGREWPAAVPYPEARPN